MSVSSPTQSTTIPIDTQPPNSPAPLPMTKIQFITAHETLSLRSTVLRNNLPELECLNPPDLLPTTFHLGLYINDVNNERKLVCILTCMKEKSAKIPITQSQSTPTTDDENSDNYNNIDEQLPDAFRLRGMATLPNYRRLGFAKELLVFAMNHIKNELNVGYLWFNARVNAFPFYEAIGFEYMSDEFDIPGIGPHKEMYKVL